MPLVYVFCLLLFSQLMLLLSAGLCPPSFDCGYLGKIEFPFTNTTRQDCGLVAIHYCNDSAMVKQIQVEDGGKLFDVIQVHNQAIHIRDHNLYRTLQSKNCEVFSNNYTLPSSFHFNFTSVHIQYEAPLFRCNHTLNVSVPPDIFNYTKCRGYDLYYGPYINTSDASPRSLTACTRVQLPIKDVPDALDPFTFVTADFFVQIQLSDECANCHFHNRGQCQLDSRGKFCCANGIPQENSVVKRSNLKAHLGIGLGIGLPCMLIIFGMLFLLHRRKHALSGSQFESRNSFSDPNSNPDLEGGCFHFGVPLFSYKDLKDATNNFDRARELGDGGFGTVYYGELLDGREVAVKRLYEHNYRRVEQFMNEVEILTRLRHRNLVSLYGCTSRLSHELLLVYEYIPNGTVASHLHGDKAKPGLLPWSIRMKIAIETASALSYLHASDIIHRDVKTNNILLDNNYCVKVADFGLSRLFPNDVTHVSTAPQGTPGYVDPEYHQCYQLTSKSDVYSFGVVLMELISSMPAVDMNRDKDEINLSNLAMKKIQEGVFSELVDSSLGFESENEIKRKIVSVAELAFQCLQRDTDMRPSMDEVLQVLRGIEGRKDEPELAEEDHAHGARISHSNVHPPPPPSPDWDEVGLLKSIKPPPSPNTVTDKWESVATTPNVSG